MAEEDFAPEDGVAGDIDAPEEEAPDSGAENTEEDYQPVTTDELASRMGWTPKEQWRGDPDKWKPSDEFLSSTVDVNRNLSGTVKRLEQTIAGMSRAQEAALERAVAQERQRLLEERNDAFEAGDSKRFNEVDKRLGELQVPQVQTVNPEAQAFMERNTWMQTDQDAANWATNRAGELARQGISETRQLQIVEREAKSLFPEHFEQPKQQAKPAPLNKPGARGGKPAVKGAAHLPAEAKDAGAYYVKKGVFNSMDDYAKAYFAENSEA